MSFLRNKRRIVLILGYVLVLTVAFFIIETNISRGTTTSEAYKQQTRNALAEVSVPTSNSQTEIATGVQNLSNFMMYRAGVQVSQSNKAVLESTEKNFWDNSKRVNATALTQILTEIAVEQIPLLSNAEIASITEAFRGFNAPGLPAGFVQNRDYTTLRASGQGKMSATGFSSELTSLRDGDIGTKIAHNMVYLAISAQVDRRTKAILDAEPQFFGGTESDMTPTQALLVAYSVATDDPLTYDQGGLQQKMQSIHQGIQQATGSSYPSPIGHKAFGNNGYIFSTPASLILDDSRITRLLDLIQQRGQ